MSFRYLPLAVILVSCFRIGQAAAADPPVSSKLESTHVNPSDALSLRTDMAESGQRRPAFTSDTAAHPSGEETPSNTGKVADGTAKEGAAPAVKLAANSPDHVGGNPATPDTTDNESREIKRPQSRKSTKAASVNSTPAQVRADRKGLAPAASWPFVDMIPLLAVLGLIAAAAYMLKRWMPARSLAVGSGVLKIIARTPVSPKQNLMLVKLGGRLVLVGVSPERMNALTTVDDPDQVALLLGQIESQRPGSIAQTFGRSFTEETRAYEDPLRDEDSELEVRGQIHGLLHKIRQLAGRRDVA